MSNIEIEFVRLNANTKRTPKDGSFQNFSSLFEVFSPSSLNKIGNSTFCGCSSLKKKKINFESSSSLTFIGEKTCKNIDSFFCEIYWKLYLHFMSKACTNICSFFCNTY